MIMYLLSNIKGDNIMNIRNRKADVAKLRCNVCQDFLKLVMKEGWQQILYKKAEGEIKKEIAKKPNYAINYRGAYEKMRDVGIDNYKFEDMDITIMNQIINYMPELVSIHNNIKKIFIDILDDRKIYSHSHENESDEELFLQELLALYHLKYYVKSLDDITIDIPDRIKLEYRQKYVNAITELIDKLDEERIELVQIYKDMDKDIQLVLNCEDEKERHNKWCSVWEKQFKACYGSIGHHDISRHFDFFKRASDAGIKEAYLDTLYFYVSKKDFENLEQNIILIYKTYEPTKIAYKVIDSINEFVKNQVELTDNLKNIINELKQKGCKITQNKEGIYCINQ